MAGAIKTVEGGTLTTVPGFLAGATYAGLKTYSEDKLDLGLVSSETPCAAAGVFTTSAIRSPTITVNQEHLAQGPVRGLVVNAGIANACVGEQGYTDAKNMAAMAAQRLGRVGPGGAGVQHRHHRRRTAHVADWRGVGEDRADL